KPNGILAPNLINDDPAPHRFAQGVGAAFLLAASIALLSFGSPVLGWVLAWIVIILAAVNLVFNFCAGCFVYYRLDLAGWMPRPRAAPSKEE
ncbi:MAG: DUF4395 domain-containing protein, partial [Anaerolineae bacterium]